MQYWLMKAEESDYSIDDLARDGRIHWYGVRNYQARNYMRDEMKVGDMVLYYHSNAKPSGVVGVARVASAPYPDETQFDQKNKYYYPKATREKPVWMLVDVEFVEKFKECISLAKLREVKTLHGMQLLRPGNRLSITPVTKKEFEIIIGMGDKYIQ
jgi:predicted RNA-binding protein with PUA-like domain